MITQEHIAQKLNVSLSTVCRSLKGSRAISQDTKAAVEDMANKLGYKHRKYNKTSRSSSEHNGNILETGSQVGVLVNANTANKAYMSVLAPMMEGISFAARELGLSMVCHYLSEDEALNLCNEENYLPMMRSKELLGLIYLWPFPSAVMKKLSSLFPSVSLNHHYDGVPIPTITSNQEEGMEIIVKHLCALGHRKIVFLGPEDPNELLYPRFAGYLSGLHKNNIAIDMSLVLNVLDVEYSESQYGEKVVELIEKKGITAVVAASGTCGNVLLNKLKSKGIRAPEALSVAGYDALAHMNGDGQRLSGVESPHKEMGLYAVNKLYSINTNKNGQEKTIIDDDSIIQLPTVFVEGDTVGAI